MFGLAAMRKSTSGHDMISGQPVNGLNIYISDETFCFMEQFFVEKTLYHARDIDKQF